MGVEALTTSQIIGFAEAVDDEVNSLLVAGTGITLSYNDGANTLTIAASGGAGIGGSTGSTDNAIIRADGTGGSTVQSSALTITDAGSLNWNASLGSITHVLGPTDQTFNIRGGVAAQAATANAGRPIDIRGANAVAGTNSVTAASGGNVTIQGGDAATNGNGSPFPAAVGGSVTIQGGSGASSGSASSNGGSVNILPGAPGSGSAAGTINIGLGTLGQAAYTYAAGAINISTAVNSGGSGNHASGAITIQAGRGSDSSSASANAGATVSVAAAPGNRSTATGGTGGNGGIASLTSGAGGDVTGTSGTVTGGVGGSCNITSGSGGAATSASGTRVGGAGGALNLSAGTGGSGTTTNGAGGSITLTAGSSGAGAGTTAAAGRINLNSRVSGTSNLVGFANGSSAQGVEIYNTETSATSYERLNLKWAANVCTINTEKGSAGGTLRGLKIGGAITDLLGFYGVTPVDQPDTVADPTGGATIDSEARTAINAIIDRLQELGLIA